MSEMLRLNKVLARAGICSRRKADVLIISGHVTINGTVVTKPGTMVDPGRDLIRVQGRKILEDTSRDEGLLYVMLNKPPGVVTTVSDPENRKTVLDLLPERFKSRRLYPVGRLDYFSEGLLILTNHGELTHRLTHPSWNHPKVYQVLVREKPSPGDMNKMARGMTLDDGQRLAPVSNRILSCTPQGTTIEMILIQGVNRQIRRMCSTLGLTILKLIRVRHGPLGLGKLEPGQCRELTSGEILELLRSVGLDINH